LFIAVRARVVENTSEHLTLSCTISGFVSNIPEIAYGWILNDTLIPHPHAHYHAAAVVHSETERADNPKFVVSFDGNELNLSVNNPSKLCGMHYLFFICLFCSI